MAVQPPQYYTLTDGVASSGVMIIDPKSSISEEDGGAFH